MKGGAPRMLLLMRAWHPELEMKERMALRDYEEKRREDMGKKHREHNIDFSRSRSGELCQQRLQRVRPTLNMLTLSLGDIGYLQCQDWTRKMYLLQLVQKDSPLSYLLNIVTCFWNIAKNITYSDMHSCFL